MSLAAKAIDKLVNPSRVSNPDRLRDAVSGANVPALSRPGGDIITKARHLRRVYTVPWPVGFSIR